MNNGDRDLAAGAGPPEIEAELVVDDGVAAPPRMEAARDQTNQTPRPPGLKPRLVVAASGLAILAVAAGAFWILKPERAPRHSDPASAGAAVAQAPSPPSSAAGAERPAEKIVNIGPARAATGVEAEAAPSEPGAAPPPPPGPDGRVAADLASGDGETSPTNEIGVAPTPADEAPGKTAPAPQTAPASDASEAFERLAAEAAARDAAEAFGMVDVSPVSPPPPEAQALPAVAPPEERALAVGLDAPKASFEAETARLAAELGAERARADQQRAEIAALRAEVDAARNAAARESLAGAGEPAPAVAVLALLALSRAIEDGRPFEIELARLERLKGASPAIRRLSAAAGAGAPTRAALKERFPDLARKALADDARAKAKGPLGAILAGFARLVTVMPSRPAAGARPAAILSRAKSRLDADDIPGARSEIAALAGAARATFEAWLADSGRYVEARAALADLNAELLEEGVARGAP